MAASVNKVILVGNLGRDPEVKSTSNGGKIVNLSLATSETWKDRSTGERKEKTEWHRVVIFNENLAAVAERYLKKGSTVYIEGQLQTREWTDNAGVKKYTTEVVLGQFRGELTMLGSRNDGARDADDRQDGGGQTGGGQTGGYQNSRPRSAPAARAADPFDDDIPF